MGAVRHRFTVEEYHLMGEAGIFHEDDRVELIDGEVLEMAAIGKRHVESVMRLTRLLSRWALLTEDADGVGDVFYVGVQNPVILSEYGEPQPDLALVRRRGDRSGTPTPEEVLLAVEVADTSLAHDRNVKLPRYAEAGIPEAWLVDLNADAIEAYSEPGPAGYEKTARISRGERLVSATVPDFTFNASEALPPEG